MVKHIVFWKVEGGPSGENAQKVKELLEGLKGKIPGMLELEVGFDFSNSEQSADVALYSVFNSKEALDGYIVHPEHQKVVPFIKSVAKERRVVDYVI